MNIFKKISVAVLVGFIAIQFYRPSKNNTPGNTTQVFVTETNPSDEVRAIFDKACYDCHSNYSEYPWYNNVAPVSFWISNHIDEGKQHLNFSDWQTYTMNKKIKLLEEIKDEVSKGEMPLAEYTWVHASSRLTPIEKLAVKEWVSQTQIIYQLGRQPN